MPITKVIIKVVRFLISIGGLLFIIFTPLLIFSEPGMAAEYLITFIISVLVMFGLYRKPIEERFSRYLGSVTFDPVSSGRTGYGNLYGSPHPNIFYTCCYRRVRCTHGWMG